MPPAPELPIVAVKRWLREEMRALPGVRACVLGQHEPVGSLVREADLVIRTWTGSEIHVHLIDEPIKLPRLRRVLETATGIGIPCVFMVDGKLLPRHGEHVPADRWFIPLQALADDRLYSYHLTGGEVKLIPVQFRPLTRTEVDTVYGQPIRLMRLRHARASVRHPALKGSWLLADFENELSTNAPPIRRTDYSAYQPPPPQAEARRDTPPSGPQPPASAPTNGLDACYTLLGVRRGASKEMVKMAFRRMAFQTHPDVSALPQPVAEERFRALTQAYETIKRANNWD